VSFGGEADVAQFHIHLLPDRAYPESKSAVGGSAQLLLQSSWLEGKHREWLENALAYKQDEEDYFLIKPQVVGVPIDMSTLPAFLATRERLTLDAAVFQLKLSEYVKSLITSCMSQYRRTDAELGRHTLLRVFRALAGLSRELDARVPPTISGTRWLDDARLRDRRPPPEQIIQQLVNEGTLTPLTKTCVLVAIAEDVMTQSLGTHVGGQASKRQSRYKVNRALKVARKPKSKKSAATAVHVFEFDRDPLAPETPRPTQTDLSNSPNLVADDSFDATDAAATAVNNHAGTGEGATVNGQAAAGGGAGAGPLTVQSPAAEAAVGENGGAIVNATAAAPRSRASWADAARRGAERRADPSHQATAEAWANVLAYGAPADEDIVQVKTDDIVQVNKDDEAQKIAEWAARPRSELDAERGVLIVREHDTRLRVQVHLAAFADAVLTRVKQSAELVAFFSAIKSKDVDIEIDSIDKLLRNAGEPTRVVAATSSPQVATVCPTDTISAVATITVNENRSTLASAARTVVAQVSIPGQESGGGTVLAGVEPREAKRAEWRGRMAATFGLGATLMPALFSGGFAQGCGSPAIAALLIGYSDETYAWIGQNLVQYSFQVVASNPQMDAVTAAFLARLPASLALAVPAACQTPTSDEAALSSILARLELSRSRNQCEYRAVTNARLPTDKPAPTPLSGHTTVQPRQTGTDLQKGPGGSAIRGSPQQTGADLQKGRGGSDIRGSRGGHGSALGFRGSGIRGSRGGRGSALGFRGRRGGATWGIKVAPLVQEDEAKGKETIADEANCKETIAAAQETRAKRARAIRSRALEARECLWKLLPSTALADHILGQRMIAAVGAVSHFVDKSRLVRAIAAAVKAVGKAQKSVRFWTNRLEAAKSGQRPKDHPHGDSAPKTEPPLPAKLCTPMGEATPSAAPKPLPPVIDGAAGGGPSSASYAPPSAAPKLVPSVINGAADSVPCSDSYTCSPTTPAVDLIAGSAAVKTVVPKHAHYGTLRGARRNKRRAVHSLPLEGLSVEQSLSTAQARLAEATRTTAKLQLKMNALLVHAPPAHTAIPTVSDAPAPALAKLLPPAMMPLGTDLSSDAKRWAFDASVKACLAQARAMDESAAKSGIVASEALVVAIKSMPKQAPDADGDAEADAASAQSVAVMENCSWCAKSVPVAGGSGKQPAQKMPSSLKRRRMTTKGALKFLAALKAPKMAAQSTPSNGRGDVVAKAASSGRATPRKPKVGLPTVNMAESTESAAGRTKEKAHAILDTVSRTMLESMDVMPANPETMAIRNAVGSFRQQLNDLHRSAELSTAPMAIRHAVRSFRQQQLNDLHRSELQTAQTQANANAPAAAACAAEAREKRDQKSTSEGSEAKHPDARPRKQRGLFVVPNSGGARLCSDCVLLASKKGTQTARPLVPSVPPALIYGEEVSIWSRSEAAKHLFRPWMRIDLLKLRPKSLKMADIDVWMRGNFFTEDGKGAERLMHEYDSTIASGQMNLEKLDMSGAAQEYPIAARDRAECGSCQGCQLPPTLRACIHHWYPAYLCIQSCLYQGQKEKVVVVVFPGYPPHPDNQLTEHHLLRKLVANDPVLLTDVNIRVYRWSNLQALASQIGRIHHTPSRPPADPPMADIHSQPTHQSSPAPIRMSAEPTNVAAISAAVALAASAFIV
jgi:hypothetical protein